MFMRFRKSLRERGFTLFETLLFVAVVAMLTLVASQGITMAISSQKNRSAAEHMMMFTSAMKRYIGVYSGEIANTVSADQPVLITRSMLINSGMLPSEYRDQNVFGQHICGIVTRGEDNDLHAFAVTDGGRALDDADLGAVVGLIGGEGGAVYSADSTNLRGGSGAWTFPIAQLNASNDRQESCAGMSGQLSVNQGHFAQSLVLGTSRYSNAYISRVTVEGHPEANRMETDLDMNGHSIINVGNLDITNTLQIGELIATGRVTGDEYLQIDGLATIGTACAETGLVGIDSKGAILLCKNGVWTALGSVPTGMVAFFNADECPGGWVESNGINNTRDMRGRFPRARDLGRGIDSQRAPGSAQDDAIRNITGRWRPGEHGGRSSRGYTSSGAMVAVTGGDPTEKSGGGGMIVNFDASRQVPTAGENRPKNVAMLMCQKQ